MDKELLQKKIAEIDGYIEELKPIAEDFSIEDILKDNFKFHTAERLFQLIVDTCVDINTHIIKSANIDSPDDLQSTFLTVASLNVL